MYFLVGLYRTCRFWSNTAIPAALFLGTLSPLWLNIALHKSQLLSWLCAHASVTCLAYYLIWHGRWLLSGDDDAQFWTTIMLARLKPYRNWRTFYQAIVQRSAHLQQNILVLGNKASGKSSLLSHSGAMRCSEPLRLDHTIVSQQWWQQDSSYYLECSCITNTSLNNNIHKNKLVHYFRHLIYGLGWRYQYPSFDGVIVTLSANTLFTNKEHLAPYIANLYNQVSAFHQLSPKTRVYIVITHLDKLPGFDGFFSFLDTDDFDKILGFVLQDYSKKQLDAKLSQFTHEIENYLLYALEKKPASATTQDVRKLHQFQDAIYAVQDSITHFIDALPASVAVCGCFYSSIAHTDEEVSNHTDLIPQQNTYELCTFSQPCFVKHILKSLKKPSLFTPSYSFLCVLMAIGLTISLLQHPGYFAALSHYITDKPHDEPVIKTRTLAHQYHYNNRIILQEFHAKARNPLHAVQFHFKPADFIQTEEMKNALALNHLSKKISDTILANAKACDKHTSRCVNHMLSLLVLSNKIKSYDYFLPSQKFPEVMLSVAENKLITTLDHASLSTTLGEAYQGLVSGIYHLTDPQLVGILIQQNAPSLLEVSNQAHAVVQDQAERVCSMREAMSQAIPWRAFANQKKCVQKVLETWYDHRVKYDITQLDAISFHSSKKSMHEFLEKLEYTMTHKKSIFQVITRQLDASSKLLANIPETLSSYSKLKKSYGRLAAFDAARLDKLLTKLHSLAGNIQKSKDPQHQALLLLNELADRNQSMFSKLLNDVKTDALTHSYVQTFWDILVNMASADLNESWHKQVLLPFKQHLAPVFPFNTKAKQDVSEDAFQVLMAPKGSIDTYISKYLKPFMEQTNQGLSWKKVGDQYIIQDENLLSFVMTHSVVQAMYYPDNNTQPTFEANIRLRHSSKGIRKILLQQADDSQYIDLAHPQALFVTWPNPAKSVALKLQLENQETVTVATADGPWAIIRLLHNHLSQRFSKDSFAVKFSAAKNDVEFEVHSLRKIHPLSSNILGYFNPPEQVVKTKEGE